MSQKRHLSWGAFGNSQRCRKKDIFFEMYLRCLKNVSQRRPDWDVSETSYAGWVKRKKLHIEWTKAPIFFQAVLAVKAALEIKIFLVPVNWSLQHQSRWSSYPPWRSQDCLFPLTKWIRTVEFGVLAIKKTSVRSLQIGLYSVFLSVPIKHVHEKEK